MKMAVAINDAGRAFATYFKEAKPNEVFL